MLQMLHSTASGLLSRIHLDFGVNEYLSFLGIRIEPHIHLHASVRNSYPLKSIKRLKRVEMFFCGPYRESAYLNPWYMFHLRRRHDLWFRDDENFANMPIRPCQAVILDWILTLAFSVIKDIPKVQLAGSVKKYTKEKCHYIVEHEHRERKLDYRTYGYNHAATLAGILGSPVYA
jgi:hypothetical protein